MGIKDFDVGRSSSRDIWLVLVTESEFGNESLFEWKPFRCQVLFVKKCILTLDI
jgi:hypothetical protein